MDGGLTITFISVAMFVGTFVLGFIPLLFRLNEKSLQFVSILGAGLLCGTALAITIPEGVGLLEESWRASSSSSDVPSSLNASEKNENVTTTHGPPRFLIGMALTFGFTFMFVVDQIGRRASLLANSVGITATLGLVIHGAGLEKKHIQGHLLAFSAAAPVLAITTYFILHASGSSSQNQLSATGVGMLFSAGTFLYVATVHVLPEISSRRTGRPSSDPHQYSGAEAHHERYLGLPESLTLILGVGLPMVLPLGSMTTEKETSGKV
ncbi:Zinc transporter ZIP9 [Dissostichus eleginoides]|uniref:Zinc transporter ZIP9 n=1 Tax=Dissostichus eleginoides TaxID=100907 RepID=A0AAD9CQP3_DISEL|nr:Zinc transporter ZIP9 [Dissostichus eleginoides]